MRIRIAPERRVGPGQGAVGGLLGGIAMALVLAMLAVVVGVGFWTPLRLVSAVVLGAAALDQPGFAAGPVFLGLAIHLVVSAVLGVVFAGLVGPRWPDAAVVGWGVVFGLAVWALADLVWLPIVNPPMTLLMPTLPFAAGHAVYGLVVGGYVAGRPLPGTATAPPAGRIAS